MFLNNYRLLKSGRSKSGRPPRTHFLPTGAGLWVQYSHEDANHPDHLNRIQYCRAGDRGLDRQRRPRGAGLLPKNWQDEKLALREIVVGLPIPGKKPLDENGVMDGDPERPRGTGCG